MNQRIAALLSEETTRYVFPFFWLRGEDEATLRHYMQVIHDAGCRAVCLESRPHPDFCGPRWWHDLDILIGEARRLDMKLWILDDSHFPTGYCNGRLHRQMEQGDCTLLRQSVTYRVLAECRGGERLTLAYADFCQAGPAVQTQADAYFMKEYPTFDDDRLLDVAAVPLDSGQAAPVPLYRQDGQDIAWTVPEGRWQIFGVYLTRNRGPHRDYMNMLSLPSCHTLIEAVYEPHWQHYAQEFGKTILGFFSDEPELGNGHIYQTGKRLHEVEDLPWSSEVEDSLRRLWGDSWAARLPLLWAQEADPALTAQTRYQYMDTVTRLVERDFSRQLGNWCRAHGVHYIGHMIEDHDQHTRCGSSLGHFFRGLAGEDMSGIDDIGGQVLPQGEDLDIRTKWQDHRDGTFYHFALGKLAASAAAIEPAKKGRAMCEIFGNYGWKEGVWLEKYLADHFMVRGVNHFVPHAFSARPFPDKDCPPHFYAQGNNPQYRHFGRLIRYMERVCHLISGGRAEVQAAVLYHAEADWTIGRNQYGGVVGRVLAERQIDYHFIPSDVFEDRAAFGTVIDPEARVLRVHSQAYRMLIVPSATCLPAWTAAAIADMRQACIPVVFVDEAPELLVSREGGMPAQPSVLQDVPVVPLGQLADHCAHLAQVRCSPASPFIRCLHYLGEDYELYYLLNEGAAPYTGSIRLCRPQRIGASLYRYDAWQNRCLPVCPPEDNLLSVTLEPRKGYLYLLDSTAAKGELPPAEEPTRPALRLDRWTRSVCTALRYPDFAEETPVVLPDAYEREAPDFGGFIRYETSLTLAQAPSGRTELTVSGPQEGLEVFVNGVSAGIQIVPDYCFDVTALLRPGLNLLRIEQATTLERVVTHVGSVSREAVTHTNPLGLQGEVWLRTAGAPLQLS